MFVNSPYVCFVFKRNILFSSLPDPPEWTGVLAENFELHKLQKLFHHQVLGPESIVYDQGNCLKRVMRQIYRPTNCVQ